MRAVRLVARTSKVFFIPSTRATLPPQCSEVRETFGGTAARVRTWKGRALDHAVGERQ
jgi:hypothetical protein